MTPERESPPRAGGGLEIVHPDGLVTRSGAYRDRALHAADAALRDALTDLEWARLVHGAVIRDADASHDGLDLLAAHCALLEAEARVGRAHIEVRRLRGRS